MSFPDEPSALRPKGPVFSPERALEQLLMAAEEELLKSPVPVTLIGLSFGALVAEHLLQKFPDRIKELVLISPTPHLQSVFLKMIQIVEEDLKLASSVLAQEVRELKLQITSFYDPFTQSALSYTMRDPNFFAHYWHNSTAMENWGKTLADTSYAFDLLSQKHVYEDLRDRPQLLKTYQDQTTPLTLLFGKYDPVLNLAEVRNHYQEKFKFIEEVCFNQSAHFPHLEESSKFIELLKSKGAPK